MTPTLYLHVADDGGILAIASETGRSMWINLADLRLRLESLRKARGSILLSQETGSTIADPVTDLVHRAWIPVTRSPAIHPDAKRSDGSTTLMSFAYMGAVDLIQDLLSRGVELDQEDDDGFTAVMYAANAGHELAVAVLLKGGADGNHRANDGSTALMCAAQHGYLSVVKRLLTAGADTRARRIDGLTAYEVAVRNGHQRVASILMSTEMRLS
jgi:ankyrin repeat protein